MTKDIENSPLFKAGYKQARNNMKQYGWYASVELFQLKVSDGVNHLPEEEQTYIRGMFKFVRQESDKRRAINERNMKKYQTA